MIDYGTFIRRERERLGMTRNDFASGICQIKTLARIEKGEQSPSPEQFRLLVEKMGVTGFSYTDCSMASSIRIMELERDILRLMDGRRIDELPEMLGEYQSISDGSIRCNNFYGYARAYYFMLVDDDKEAFLASCDELVDIGRPSSGKPWDCSGKTFLQGEFRILNAAAMVMAEGSEPLDGIALFNQLIISQKLGRDLLPSYWINLAILYNNAAIAEKKEFPKEAKEHIDKAQEASVRAGDMVLAVRIRRTRFILFNDEPSGRNKKVYALLLKRMYKTVNDVFGIYESFWDFLIEPCYILMP